MSGLFFHRLVWTHTGNINKQVMLRHGQAKAKRGQEQHHAEKHTVMMSCQLP